MIPDKAVEAAAEEVVRIFDGDFSGEASVTMARWILEAAAPHLLATSPVVTDEMVDAVLEHGGTPRRRLFEYPHRDDDSREMIRSAETLVRRILSMRPTNV